MLRSTRRPASDVRSIKSLLEDGDDWLTIREASAITGISATTLKKLARSKDIPSHLERTDDGFVRIVSLDGIRSWTEEVGRAADSELPETADDDTEVDLTAKEVAGGEPHVPEGTMLVPLDAWNKMLNQLGNLHEAGQQLAEARERAAKAETESKFLKERLAELRVELEQAQEPLAEPEEPARPDEAGSSSAASLVRKAYLSWRAERRRR